MCPCLCQKTSYIKMMDVWLLFNLVIPFIEVSTCKLTNLRVYKVLLQTYIEQLRGNVEDKKEINHHGNAVLVEPAVAATLNTSHKLPLEVTDFIMLVF